MEAEKNAGIQGKLCFASLTTDNYLPYLCGLYLNLKELYPEIPFAVAALDKKSEDFLKKIGDEKLIVLSGEEIWGADFWKNLQCRMKRDERAFTSKSALVEWTLEHGFDKCMFLDSDIMLLDRIDDVLNMLDKYDTILAPARFTMENWRKSRAGNFNGGIYGFSKGGLRLLRIYKSLCFENCINLPIDNLFHDQKYLDLFIHYHGTGIIRDYGINVSGTDFDELQPHQKEDGNWYVKDNVPIRLFHATAVTPKSFGLVIKKHDLDIASFEKCGGKAKLKGDRVAQKNKLKISSLANLLRVNRLIRLYWIYYVDLIKVFQCINRIISLPDYNIPTRWKETFKKKGPLLEKLREDYRKMPKN